MGMDFSLDQVGEKSAAVLVMTATTTTSSTRTMAARPRRGSGVPASRSTKQVTFSRAPRRTFSPLSHTPHTLRPPPTRSRKLTDQEIEDLLVFQEPLPDKLEGECYGCGASLQCSSEKAAGFVKLEIYETKRKHKQLGQVLCSRCHLLCNGKMVPGVEDVGTRLAAMDDENQLSGDLVTPEELRGKLVAMRNRKSLVLHLVDLTDLQVRRIAFGELTHAQIRNLDLSTPLSATPDSLSLSLSLSLCIYRVLLCLQGTFLRNVRDLVSKNPVLIVGTKMDLLPRGSNVKDVADWVLQYVEDRGLSPIGVVLCSSKR